MGHANYTTMEEIAMGEEVLVGTFFLNVMCHRVPIFTT
jgi:hypothetical protein